MRYLALVVLIISLAHAIDGSVQIPGQTVSSSSDNSDKEEEEPHPYTISFFVFPHGAANDLLDRTFNKKKALKHPKLTTNALKANATPDETWMEPKIDKEEDIDSMYQRGSVDHPSSEMYPHCHHCPRNSTFELCTKTKSLKICNNGLANICFTKSEKKGNVVHYEMGCATHRQCLRARAHPCKKPVKKCFTCCQWSGCNSQSHHNKTVTHSALHQTVTKLSTRNIASNTVVSWALFLTSFLSILIVLL